MVITGTGSVVAAKKQHPAYIRAARLEALLPAFRESADASIGAADERNRWQEARNQRAAFFEEHLTLDGIAEMDEGALHELVHRLGAFRNWTNQDWLYGEI